MWVDEMNEVNKTLYIPLYGKSEVSKKKIIINDPTAEKIWAKENFKVTGKAKSKWLTYNMAMRARIFDDWVCDMLKKNPNLTRGIRPYAFIENVVTHKDYRGCGYATECLNYAKDIAVKSNCYKMMLLTGSKKETTLKFYEGAGYNSSDKTAFIQWLE